MFVDATRETLRLLSVGSSTGALDVDDGTVYLSGGRVTFAECPLTPDLETRLVRSGTGIPADLRSVLPVLRSTVLDAAAALAPGAGVATCRYHPGRRHRAGGVAFWGVEELLAEIDALATGPAGDEVPALTAAPRGAAVFLDAGDWPLLDHVDGRASISALAWRHGLQLAATRAAVARLSSAGICRTLPTPPAPRTPAAPTPPAAQPPTLRTPAPQPSAAHPSAPQPLTAAEGGPHLPAPPSAPRPPRAELRSLPHRQRRAKAAASQPPGRVAQFAPPRDPVLLRRVLAGLRRMD